MDRFRSSGSRLAVKVQRRRLGTFISFFFSVELLENWTDTKETLLEGTTFNLRHLGMTLVDQPKGQELSMAAVKRVVATAKASGKKLQKELESNHLIEHQNVSHACENCGILHFSSPAQICEETHANNFLLVSVKLCTRPTALILSCKSMKSYEYCYIVV
uniref:Uncharacterized protein n=1 Tax=Denticeps clupeoides TaxID=299321 RepID=A0AAY4BLT9_9TELE